MASVVLLHVKENVFISMATSYGDSSKSSLTDKQLQNQNIYKGETRDLPINDHVTITEDEDGKWNIVLNAALHTILL